ncbi:unnamed protein product [Adineta steineri]|uniref:Uncharacterized protein n=1 Tax=Adineta steineri TaxID=433720 RepID=A0A818X109_9BILA|nr:unnamed protein product [Adineta steineri]CAF3733387.1 unnamed protein product [Adineta steineri]
MSDFLGRIGQITEWVVVSNLENRAVNAAVDKTQDWWKNRKQNKRHDSHPASVNQGPISSPPPLPPPPPSQPQASYPQYQPQQPYYQPPPPPTSMGGGQLLLSVNHIEGLNQWGPLVAIIECNQQRNQITLGQFQQQFSFPIYQFDYDQLFIWIQTEHQQQTIAHGEIPVRILLNNNNNWSAQPQQRWIPLQDNSNGPSGQVLVNIEYQPNSSSVQPKSGPPPPYGYYS